MTKADIINAVQSRIGFSHNLTADLVEDLFEIVKDTLAGGEPVKISGFGKFEVREKKARPGRNPRTGEALTIEARRVLTFKPSPILRRAVNRRSEP